jgi:hypothetical protein
MLKPDATELLRRLFGYCTMCGRWFVWPKRRHQGTAYADKERNWIVACKRCHAFLQDYWNEQWREYYGGRAVSKSDATELLEAIPELVMATDGTGRQVWYCQWFTPDHKDRDALRAAKEGRE